MFPILELRRKHIVLVLALLLSHGIIYKIALMQTYPVHPMLTSFPIEPMDFLARDTTSDTVSYNNTWEVEELPIMKSTSRGFSPVYVYSKDPPNRLWLNHSQAQQDQMVIALMNRHEEHSRSSESTSHRTLFFVDLASYDARVFSNTHRLEHYGWKGLCIEPNSQHWYGLALHRNCTIIAAFVGGPKEEDGKVVDVKLNGKPGTEGIVDKNFDNKDEANAKRNLVSISTVFKEAKVPSIIDYLSLDVEGAESLVMANFPWELYKIRFITIERAKDDLEAMLNENGYKKLGTIASWGETIWFHESLVSFSIGEARKIINEWHCRC